jgi:acyl carrier protein
MLPAACVQLDALPLSPTGKIDRGALPAPQFSSSTDDFVAPRTPVEHTLAATWAQVLRVERVGVHDNFFDLGGHSLAATQVVARMSKDFQVEMSLRSFFEKPTIAGQAQLIEDLIVAQIAALTDEEAEQLLSASPAGEV